jgi:hypothetical protein
VSEDPIRLAGGINPYAFAHNNPANFRDPSGLLPCDILMGTGACFYTELPGVTNGYGPKPAPGDEGPDYVCRTYGYCGMPSNYVPNGGGPGTPGRPKAPVGPKKPTQEASLVPGLTPECISAFGSFGVSLALDVAFGGAAKGAVGLWRLGRETSSVGRVAAHWGGEISRLGSAFRSGAEWAEIGTAYRYGSGVLAAEAGTNLASRFAVGVIQSPVASSVVRGIPYIGTIVLGINAARTCSAGF